MAKQDLSLRIDVVKKRYPELKLCLYGHSMGGLISCMSVIKECRSSFVAILFSGSLYSEAINVGQVCCLSHGECHSKSTDVKASIQLCHC